MQSVHSITDGKYDGKDEEIGNQEIGNQEIGNQEIGKRIRSTKEPLAKRRKKAPVQTKEDVLLGNAVSNLDKIRCEDPEDTFGKTVANGLRAIQDTRSREFAKLKIQEILFQCQFESQRQPDCSSLQQTQSPEFKSYNLNTSI